MIYPGAGTLSDSGDEESITAPLTGTATLGVLVDVGLIGSQSIGVLVDVGSLGSTSVGVSISIIDPQIADGDETVTDGGTDAAVWTAVITIDGVDVSDSIIGEVTVEAEESAARIADLALNQPAGTAVDVTDWIGRQVTIDLADFSSGMVLDSMRLFTGLVDVPTVEPRSGMIRLRCTDNRQGALESMTAAQVEALISGARWTPAVFDGAASPFVQAADRLSTVSKALDITPYGSLRLTDWAAKTIADMSFTADDILDGTPSVEIADRSGLINRVDIDFDYRFPRLKSEGYLVSYDYLALAMTSFGYWVKAGNYFLQRAAVEAALGKAGATIISMTWIPLPTTPQQIPPNAGFWLPNPVVDVQYCLGFAAVVAFDYGQEIEESHHITVSAQGSIDRVGTLREQMRGALEGVYADLDAVEQNVLLYRQKITMIPPGNMAPILVGLTNSVDATLTTESDRAAAEAAMGCLISIAMTRIHGAHRRHSVSCAVAANPVIDLDKTVSIVADGITAKGKVRRVVHRLNPDSGEATSEFQLAICKIAGTGFDHGGDSITAPPGTTDGATSTLTNPVINWNGLSGQDGVITIDFSAVDDIERNKADFDFYSAFSAPLPEDVLEITL